jgi:hypothetical protein
MSSLLKPGRPARLLAILLGLGCASTLHAEPLPFVGRWLADDRQQAPAADTVLTIKEASLSWRGPDKSTPACTRKFELKQEKPGTVYRDGRGTRFVAGAPGSLPTYLLKLEGGNCDRPADEVRISYYLVYDVRHIEVIEYVNGRALGSQRFHKAKR